MKIRINIHGQSVSVNVSIEVSEYLDHANHKTENLAHEQRRHWEVQEYNEAIIFRECNRSLYETPEQCLIRKETFAGNYESAGELYRSATPAFFVIRA